MTKGGSVADLAEILGISTRAVGKVCAQGRITFSSKKASGGSLTYKRLRGNISKAEIVVAASAAPMKQHRLAHQAPKKRLLKVTKKVPRGCSTTRLR